jgi:hypothetical protein
LQEPAAFGEKNSSPYVYLLLNNFSKNLTIVTDQKQKVSLTHGTYEDILLKTEGHVLIICNWYLSILISILSFVQIQ